MLFPNLSPKILNQDILKIIYQVLSKKVVYNTQLRSCSCITDDVGQYDEIGFWVNYHIDNIGYWVGIDLPQGV
jgi:hypothetical protein